MWVLLLPVLFLSFLLAGLYKIPRTRVFLPMRIFLSASAIVVLVCLVMLVIAIRSGVGDNLF